MNAKYKLTIVALAMLCSLTATAQQTYRFHTFSPEGGLSYDGISSITQDKSGLIWFLCDDAIYRFDGYTYKRYNTVSDTPNRTLIFNQLCTDNQGLVYAVAAGDGIYVYSRATDSFHKRYSGTSSRIFIDSLDRIWHHSEGKVAYLEDGVRKEPLYKGKPLTFIPTAFSESRQGLLMSTYYNIYRYDYDTDQLSFVYGVERGNRIQSIAIDNDRLWILVKDKGLYGLSLTDTSCCKHYDFMMTGGLGKQPLRKVCVDKLGMVWIAAQKGLYVFNPATEQHRLFTHSPVNRFSLPNNSVWDMTNDRQNNMWVGTFSGGLCYVSPDENQWIDSYTPLYNALSSNQVSSFAEDGNRLWVATEGGGLNIMNRQNGAIERVLQSSDAEKLSYDNTKSIVLDRHGKLWIAMFRGGLDCYNTHTGQYTHHRHHPKDNQSLISDDLRKLILDDDKGLWILYQHNRAIMSYYSFEKQTFTHDTLSTDLNYLYDFCKADNKLWVVSNRVYCIETDSKTASSYAPDNLNLKAQCVCVDSNGTVWIGTVGNGIVSFNPDNRQFTTHPEILRHKVYSIFSICAHDGYIWLGTDNGLFRYDPKQDKYLHFDKEDGCSGNVYYPLAAYQSADGLLYFGTTNGFTVINPAMIRENTRQPQPILLDFFIDYSPTIPKHEGEQTDTLQFPRSIVLTHEQSTFGFQFSCDNYLIPNKNKYKYRLYGYDNQWQEVTGQDRTAYYPRIPAGNYTFELMVANNDGVWNTTPYTIHIQRLEAPWRSNTAIWLYMIGLTGVILLLFRFYQQYRANSMKRYLAQVDKQRQEEIHQSQLAFFTSVSHDFRTPLFLITAAVDKIKETGWKDEFYKILSNNANRLLSLVNDLMDFRKIERMKLTLHVQQLPVNATVKAIAYDFYSLAQSKQIRFDIRMDDRLDACPIDKDVLERILLNLLNNAFKYTPAGGAITVETFASSTAFTSSYANGHCEAIDNLPENLCRIVIRDTGFGIAPEAISKVFGSYYQAGDNNHQPYPGTGIGLALVKSLVLLHKGRICLYSEQGKGTDLIVDLATNADYYSEEEKKVEERLTDEPVEARKDFGDYPADAPHELILLAEDNEDLRYMIAESLADKYTVIQAENGSVATEVLKNNTVNLIISDILMPEKDGITFCREVKADFSYSHIPFILLTAKSGLDSRMEGVDAGGDLYLEKPVNLQLLKASIRNLLNARRTLQEYYAQNYFAEAYELAQTQEDKAFLKRLTSVIEQNLEQEEMDVNFIAAQMMISRTKLYNKVKGLTDKSVVEFILGLRLRKAARLLVEQNLPIKEVMVIVGIESQSYFTKSFKKEFGETPTAFVKSHTVGHGGIG